MHCIYEYPIHQTNMSALVCLHYTVWWTVGNCSINNKDKVLYVFPAYMNDKLFSVLAKNVDPKTMKSDAATT